MNTNRLLSVIGIVGTVTGLVAFIDSYFLGSTLSSLFRYPIKLQVWIIVLIGALISAISFFASKRLKTNQDKTISSNTESVQNFMSKRNLLSSAKSLDLCLYTAETLVIPWRHLLEEHPRPIKIRLLCRRPEKDSKKQNAAEASLDTMLEIMGQNDNINIDVHFYNANPMLRMQLFYRDKDAVCLLGFYRHDDLHPMRWIGAENNSMVVLENKTDHEKQIMNALGSQFEFQWSVTSPIRSVIFDMDGVLINSMEYHFRAWERILNEIGVKFRIDDLKTEIYQREGQKDEELIQHLCEKYWGKKLDKKAMEKFVTLKRKYYLESTNKIAPQEDVYKILDQLKERGIPLAVVTGTEREAAKQIIDKLFPNYFNVLISGSDVLRGKPNPEAYQMAIKQLGISKTTHCIVIENAPSGIRSAKDADLIAFGLLIGSPLSPGHLIEAGAFRVFNSFEELLQGIDLLSYSDIWKMRKIKK